MRDIRSQLLHKQRLSKLFVTGSHRSKSVAVFLKILEVKIVLVSKFLVGAPPDFAPRTGVIHRPFRVIQFQFHF